MMREGKAAGEESQHRAHCPWIPQSQAQEHLTPPCTLRADCREHVGCMGLQTWADLLLGSLLIRMNIIPSNDL